MCKSDFFGSPRRTSSIVICKIILNLNVKHHVEINRKACSFENDDKQHRIHNKKTKIKINSKTAIMANGEIRTSINFIYVCKYCERVKQTKVLGKRKIKITFLFVNLRKKKLNNKTQLKLILNSLQ